ncbi:MAG: HAMP domain-containing sensor histidine kinase [Candidatus Dormibacteria bacterium]
MRANRPGRSHFVRRFGLRTSLAGRLLAGGIVFTALVIAGVSGFLLVSRSQQTNAGALSNADNRAGVAAQLMSRVIQPQAQYAATAVASLTSLQLALSGTNPTALVAAEFTQKRIVNLPGLAVAILDNHGTVLYTSECDSLGPAGETAHPATSVCEQSRLPHVVATLASVRDALQVAATTACQQPGATIAASPALRAQCPSGVEGVEALAGGLPALDVAVPVYNVQAGTDAPLGVVVYSAQLQTQFARYGPVIGYTPVFVSAGSVTSLIRFSGGADTPTPSRAPSTIAQQLGHPTTTSTGVAAHGIYTVAGAGSVAGSFVSLMAPGGTRVAGYLGVEVPLSIFAAGTAQDEGTIAQIAFTALVVVCLLVLLFVDRFVRRPVSRLERGVERIAAGDYTTDIPVASRDELGRLAAGVNRMRDQIAGYIEHIDGSVGRLQEVSRALTMTTGGIEQLQDAVLGAADAIAGGSTSAAVYTRRGAEFLRMRRRGPEMPDMAEAMPVDELSAGHAVRLDWGGRAAIAVPMLFQEALTGVLVVGSERPVAESDERALITLANNAAVAVENTRTLEQEREAVRRLRELNQLKSDFLDTAQHELRTPVLAIQGQIELLNVAWGKWDDETKLEIVRDVDISVKLLSETVENIVDFALVNSDTIDVRMTSVDVTSAIGDAVSDVRRHFKDGLPVELAIDVHGSPAVNADPFRLRQVLRALIDNAVKFTPGGGHVSVSARPVKGARLCRIDVADDGIGISAEAIPRLFDRFYQEDNSRTRRHGGMGMGLALVRRLCDAHGATVKAESDAKGGSRFTILWPLADVPPESAPAALFFEPVPAART